MKEKKTSLLTSKEVELLSQCALYISKTRRYNVNGEELEDTDSIEELQEELYRINNTERLSAGKKKEETELKRKELVELKRKEKEKYGIYNFGIELYHRKPHYSTRKNTLDKRIEEIDRFITKSNTVQELKTYEGVRKELLVIYILFTSITELISHNHQQAIAKFTENNMKVPEGGKKQTPRKWFSQITYDVSRTKYEYKENKYSKGEFLNQSFNEIKADRFVFDRLLLGLNIINEEKKIEKVMDRLSSMLCESFYKFDKKKNESLDEFRNRNKRNIVKTTLFFDKSTSKSISNIKYLDELISNWSKEQDDTVSDIFIELFNLEVSEELRDEILASPYKTKDFGLGNFIGKDSEEIRTLLDSFNKNKKLEMEDRLESFTLLDSYYRAKVKEHREKTWI